GTFSSAKNQPCALAFGTEVADPMIAWNGALRWKRSVTFPGGNFICERNVRTPGFSAILLSIRCQVDCAVNAWLTSESMCGNQQPSQPSEEKTFLLRHFASTPFRL